MEVGKKDLSLESQMGGFAVEKKFLSCYKKKRSEDEWKYRMIGDRMIVQQVGHFLYMWQTQVGSLALHTVAIPHQKWSLTTELRVSPEHFLSITPKPRWKRNYRMITEFSGGKFYFLRTLGSLRDKCIGSNFGENEKQWGWFFQFIQEIE